MKTDHTNQGEKEGYPTTWVKLVLMVSPMGEYHAIGGETRGEPGTDAHYVGLERIKARNNLRLCGYCKTWNGHPCGHGCYLQPSDPTWDQLNKKEIKP